MLHNLKEVIRTILIRSGRGMHTLLFMGNCFIFFIFACFTSLAKEKHKPVLTNKGYGVSNLVTEDINGITWYRYVPELVTGHQKLFRNGSEGWLTHANKGVLFVKQFCELGTDQEAPGEAEIEIYANKDRTYIELENQGPYTTLSPGESIGWIVKWFVRKIPDSILVKTGNKNLTDFVRKTISYNKTD